MNNDMKVYSETYFDITISYNITDTRVYIHSMRVVNNDGQWNIIEIFVTITVIQ